MRLDTLVTSKRQTLSFEFFPAKTDKAGIMWRDAVAQLADLGPDFTSVTYGAGGTTRAGTKDAIVHIQESTGLPAMAHLTCVGNSRAEIAELLDEYAEAGICNLLALRGDPPRGQDDWQPHPDGFTYASELIDTINEDGRFAVACAAFPEGHPDAPDLQTDWTHLGNKLPKTCLGVSQAFFDVNHFTEMVAHLQQQGITTPVVPGILPIRSWSWAKNFVEKFCPTTTLPDGMRAVLEPVDGDPIASRKAGLAYTIRLCEDLLAAGAPGLHIYTLNKPTPAAEVVTALRMNGAID